MCRHRRMRWPSIRTRTMPLAEGTTRSDPLIGQTLDGRYRIETVLGEGGMGVVYKAVHTALGKPLAIKVLRPRSRKDEEIVERFLQEAQSAIGDRQPAHHRHQRLRRAARRLDLLRDGVPRRPVAHRSASRRANASTPERTLHIAKQLAGALGAAHERGIVHRDLKPDNVFLVKRGSDNDFVKVLDFGIAKVGGSDEQAHAGRPGLRHAALHVARAGAGHERRSPHRHLRARRDHVRDGDAARCRSTPTTSWAS